MPISPNNPLFEMANKAVSNPSIWKSCKESVSGLNFIRQLGPKFIEVAQALSDAHEIAPPPLGFLIGALAFEMTSAFNIENRSRNIVNTGLRILEETFTMDHLSLRARVDVCTKILAEDSFQGHQIRKAETHIHRAKSYYFLGNENESQVDYNSGIAIIRDLSPITISREDRSISFHVCKKTSEFLRERASNDSKSWLAASAAEYKKLCSQFIA